MYLKQTVIFLLYLLNYNVSAQTLNLEKGDSCGGNNSRVWKCELLKNCPQVGDFRKNRPKICKFEGIDPIICCPPAPTVPVANQALVSNGNANISCKMRLREKCEISPVLVLGGSDAPPKKYHYMAAIGFGEENSKSWKCGGTLISARWVLSAAHCSDPKSSGPARWARLGDLDLSSTNDDARPQDKIIIDRIVHPSYKETEVYNDIVLFKLDSNVIFNDWVAPICLQTATKITAPKGIVTGWGRLEFAGPTSSKLQEAEITIVESSQCTSLYENNKDSKLPRGIDGYTMVCAGEKQGGKDACSGDSGGPLIIQEDDYCLKTQIGITSFGRKCGLPDSPGVYTRVSYFVPWIESIVWPNS